MADSFGDLCGYLFQGVRDFTRGIYGMFKTEVVAQKEQPHQPQGTLAARRAAAAAAAGQSVPTGTPFNRKM